jgi:hypothetical protein
VFLHLVKKILTDQISKSNMDRSAPPSNQMLTLVCVWFEEELGGRAILLFQAFVSRMRWSGMVWDQLVPLRRCEFHLL